MRAPSVAQRSGSVALLDGIFELFSRPFARVTLGASFVLAVLVAVATTSTTEVSELTGNEIEVVENFDEALIGGDWTEYL